MFKKILSIILTSTLLTSTLFLNVFAIGIEASNTNNIISISDDFKWEYIIKETDYYKIQITNLKTGDEEFLEFFDNPDSSPYFIATVNDIPQTITYDNENLYIEDNLGKIETVNLRKDFIAISTEESSNSNITTLSLDPGGGSGVLNWELMYTYKANTYLNYQKGISVVALAVAIASCYITGSANQAAITTGVIWIAEKFLNAKKNADYYEQTVYDGMSGYYHVYRTVTNHYADASFSQYIGTTILYERD